jgi:hypothetical protein
VIDPTAAALPGALSAACATAGVLVPAPAAFAAVCSWRDQEGLPVAWGDGEVGWIVVWSAAGGEVPQRVRVSDPLGDALAGRGALVCRPCDAAGDPVGQGRPWHRWPDKVFRTRAAALRSCG